MPSNNITSAASRGRVQLAEGNGHVHLPTYPSRNRLRFDTIGVTPPRAVFLDRDGVLVEDVHFLERPEQLNILPGVSQALQVLQGRFYLIVATNQSGIARGLFTEADLLAVHTELAQRLWEDGAKLDAIYFCPHLPEGPVETYSVSCRCRKPGPGMLLTAAQDFGIDLAGSYMVGDSVRDAEAALAVGVNAVLIGGASHKSVQGVTVASDLLTAARQISGSPKRPTWTERVLSPNQGEVG